LSVNVTAVGNRAAEFTSVQFSRIRSGFLLFWCLSFRARIDKSDIRPPKTYFFKFVISNP
jgi:hypothetical protein